VPVIARRRRPTIPSRPVAMARQSRDHVRMFSNRHALIIYQNTVLFMPARLFDHKKNHLRCVQRIKLLRCLHVLAQCLSERVRVRMCFNVQIGTV
jgi:hypothetical protein